MAILVGDPSSPLTSFTGFGPTPMPPTVRCVACPIHDTPTVYTGWRSVPRAELLASRAYAEYYAPRGLGDVIAAGFVDGDYISHEMTSFACFRAHDDAAYSDADVAFVERSLPAFGEAIARFRPPPVLDTPLRKSTK